MIRLIYLAHESPGRIRLRLPYLRHAHEVVEPLADRLSAMDGMEEVRIRPYTGSVLCTFDPHTLDTRTILDAVKKQTGIAAVLRHGERSDEEELALAEEALQQGSDLARSVACMFKGMNLEMLRASGGRIDLGTAAAVAFAGAGIAEVVATGKLPMPPWFNLGWWAFRMFMTTEKAAIENTPAEAPEPREATEVHAE